MSNLYNQNMLTQGNDFINQTNVKNNLTSGLNINSNSMNQSQTQYQNTVLNDYTEMESNFNKLLSKYSNLQNKVMQDSLKGEKNQRDLEILNEINSQLISLSQELDKKMNDLKLHDKDLSSKLKSQHELLKKYNSDMINSTDNYNSYSPSLNELNGEVDESYTYYKYNYSWYLMWLLLTIIIFYLIFSISANGFSSSNGLLIVVIALILLYLIKRFIEYARWSWNFQIPSWKPHINIQGPKVVFREYIPQ